MSCAMINGAAQQPAMRMVATALRARPGNGEVRISHSMAMLMTAPKTIASSGRVTAIHPASTPIRIVHGHDGFFRQCRYAQKSVSHSNPMGRYESDMIES